MTIGSGKMDSSSRHWKGDGASSGRAEASASFARDVKDRMRQGARVIGLDGNTAGGKAKREKMSYRVRYLLMVAVFVAVMLVYMFSFIFGTQTGLAMEDVSKTFLGFFTNAASALCDATGIGVLSLLGSGLVRFFAIGPVAVASCGALLSLLVAGVVATIVSARRTWLRRQSDERHFLSAEAGNAGIR